jgi:hypothetical protein
MPSQCLIRVLAGYRRGASSHWQRLTRPAVAIGGSLSGKPEENLFKILNSTTADFDPFSREHFDFSLYRDSRCLSLKSSHPTG